jgi:hypothetical protein
MATDNLGLTNVDIETYNAPFYWERRAADAVVNGNMELIDAWAGTVNAGLSSGSAATSALTQVYLTADAAVSGTIRVSGQVQDALGVSLTGSLEVFVTAISPSAASGTLSIVSGTEKVTINAGATDKISQSWITTTASGTFVFDVNDEETESVLVIVQSDHGLSSVKNLTFV